MFLNDLYSEGQSQQAVFPSLVAGTADRKDQVAAFPQQFPNSWSSYLSQAPTATPEAHWTNPSAALPATADGSATQPQPEAKQERLREKNRRAMQKFRAKQKVRCSHTLGQSR